MYQPIPKYNQNYVNNLVWYMYYLKSVGSGCLHFAVLLQLIREVKEGLRLAVLNRKRYLDNVKTSLWNCSEAVVESFKRRVTYFDTSVHSVLEVLFTHNLHQPIHSRFIRRRASASTSHTEMSASVQQHELMTSKITTEHTQTNTIL